MRGSRPEGEPIQKNEQPSFHDRILVFWQKAIEAKTPEEEEILERERMRLWANASNEDLENWVAGTAERLRRVGVKNTAEEPELFARALEARAECAKELLKLAREAKEAKPGAYEREHRRLTAFGADKIINRELDQIGKNIKTPLHRYLEAIDALDDPEELSKLAKQLNRLEIKEADSPETR